MRRPLSPHLAIVWAAHHGTGLRLTAEEVRELAMDHAIDTCAAGHPEAHSYTALLDPHGDADGEAMRAWREWKALPPPRPTFTEWRLCGIAGAIQRQWTAEHSPLKGRRPPPEGEGERTEERYEL